MTAQRINRPGRALLLALAVLLLALLPARSAYAHAALVGTDPPDGAALDQAPASITLRFNESVQPVAEATRLVDGGGSEWMLNPAVSDDDVVIDLPADLGDGAYYLNWRVVSADGHPIAGVLSFTVGDAGPAAAPPPETAEPAPWAATAAASLHYFGLLVFAGLLCFRIAIARADPPRPRHRLLRAAGVAAVLGAAFAVPLNALDAAGLGPERIADPGAWAGLVSKASLVLLALTVFGVVSAYALYTRGWSKAGHDGRADASAANPKSRPANKAPGTIVRTNAKTTAETSDAQAIDAGMADPSTRGTDASDAQASISCAEATTTEATGTSPADTVQAAPRSAVPSVNSPTRFETAKVGTDARDAQVQIGATDASGTHAASETESGSPAQTAQAESATPQVDAEDAKATGASPAHAAQAAKPSAVPAGAGPMRPVTARVRGADAGDAQRNAAEATGASADRSAQVTPSEAAPSGADPTQPESAWTAAAEATGAQETTPEADPFTYIAQEEAPFGVVPAHPETPRTEAADPSDARAPIADAPGASPVQATAAEPEGDSPRQIAPADSAPSGVAPAHPDSAQFSVADTSGAQDAAGPDCGPRARAAEGASADETLSCDLPTQSTKQLGTSGAEAMSVEEDSASAAQATPAFTVASGAAPTRLGTARVGTAEPRRAEANAAEEGSGSSAQAPQAATAEASPPGVASSHSGTARVGSDYAEPTGAVPTQSVTVRSETSGASGAKAAEADSNSPPQVATAEVARSGSAPALPESARVGAVEGSGANATTVDATGVPPVRAMVARLDSGSSAQAAQVATATAFSLGRFEVARSGSGSLRRLWAGSAALGAAALALAAPVFVGHTMSFGLRSLMVAADLVHLVTGAIWAGGLAGLLILLRRMADPAATAAVVARFSAWAGWSVAALGASGLVMALSIHREWDAFLASDHGRALLAKLALVAVALVLAGWNRLRLVPLIAAAASRSAGLSRLRRVLLAEAAAVTAVVALTGLLVHLSPATEPVEAAPPPGGEATVQAALGDGEVQLHIAPGTAGENAFELTITDANGQPLEPLEPPTVSAVLPERDFGPIDAVVHELALGAYHCIVDLPLAGTWEVTVQVRISEFGSEAAVIPVDVGG